MSDPASRSAPALSFNWLTVSLALFVATCVAAPATAQQAQVYAPGSWSTNNDPSCPSPLAQPNASFCIVPDPENNFYTIGNPPIAPQATFLAFPAPTGSAPSCVISFHGTGTLESCPGLNVDPSGYFISYRSEERRVGKECLE